MRELLAGCLVLSCWSSEAAAQDNTTQLAELRARFEAAADEFERGLYASAAEHFDEVWEGLRALNHPRAALVLFNLGRSHEELGDYGLAMEHYERFLRDAPDGAPGRSEAEDRLAELRRRVTSLDPDSTSRSETVVAMERDQGAASGWWVGAGVSYGLAALGFVTMAVAGGLALDSYQTANLGCGATTSCTEDEVSDIRTLGIVSDVGLGVGAAAGVAGTVFLILALNGTDDDARAAILLPALDSTQAGLQVRGTF